MDKLLGYDFEIQYKEGKKNRVIDTLSHVVDMIFISMVNNVDWSIIVEGMTQDEQLHKLIQELAVDPKYHPSFEFKNDCFGYKGMVVLSHKSTKIPSVLEEFHASL